MTYKLLQSSSDVMEIVKYRSHDDAVQNGRVTLITLILKYGYLCLQLKQTPTEDCDIVKSCEKCSNLDIELKPLSQDCQWIHLKTKNSWLISPVLITDTHELTIMSNDWIKQFFFLMPDNGSGNSWRGEYWRKDWPDHDWGLRWCRPRLHGSPSSTRRFIPALRHTPWASFCSHTIWINKLFCVLSAFSFLRNHKTLYSVQVALNRFVDVTQGVR